VKFILNWGRRYSLRLLNFALARHGPSSGLSGRTSSSRDDRSDELAGSLDGPPGDRSRSWGGKSAVTAAIWRLSMFLELVSRSGEELGTSRLHFVLTILRASWVSLGSEGEGISLRALTGWNGAGGNVRGRRPSGLLP
jgi:hypothetical protein